MRQRRNYYLTLGVALAVNMSACSGGGSSASDNGPTTVTTVETAASGVTKALSSNVIPTLNSDAGLSIKDADNNGVRDDVDALIKNKYTLPAQIAAATQYARAAQMATAASAPTSSAVTNIAAAMTQAVDCAVAQMGAASAAGMMAEVRAATVNTKERFTAYRATQAALSGQHAVITEDDPKTFCK